MTSWVSRRLVNELGDIDAKELATFPLGDGSSGIVLRVGRYGPYIERPADPDSPKAARTTTARPRWSGPTCPTTCRPTS